MPRTSPVFSLKLKGGRESVMSLNSAEFDTPQKTLVDNIIAMKTDEVFFHWVTSWIEVEGLVRIAIADETTINALCQKKMGFHNGPMVDDCGFGKGPGSLIFVSTAD